MEQKRTINWKKVVPIGVGLLVLLLIINYFLSGKKEATINKLDKSKSYVYQEASKKVASSTIYSYLPYINLIGDDAQRVNTEIKKQYHAIDKTAVQQLTYHYAVNREYLSLAILLTSLENPEGYPHTTITTYTFRIANAALTSEQELLNDFGREKQTFVNDFNRVMETYYQEALTKNYLSALECDYQCFLTLHEGSEDSSKISLFVQNDQLLYYRPFLIFTTYQDEKMYQQKEEDFLFELGKTT